MGSLRQAYGSWAGVVFFAWSASGRIKPEEIAETDV